ALLQNFAAHAVIAMENARLLTQTREALEQQTATAEVLGVINSSPGNLTPVFDVILEKAHILCGAVHGVLVLRDGENFHAVGARGLPEAFAEQLRKGFPNAGNPVAQPLLDGAPFVQLPDVSQIDHPVSRAGASVAGLRTLMAVPLRKDDALLGWIVAARREVRLFSEKQIALLQNFAVQAVIAMENARLLGELRQRTRDLEESLEYQTATSDVLNVISRSTADVQPVLDTVVETAARLCAAENAWIWIREGEVYRPVAYYGGGETQHWAAPRPRASVPGRDTPTRRGALEGKVVHVADIRADPEYAVSEVRRRRTVLGVPLLRESEPIGVITLNRLRVDPFTERQIELVRTFADQAVIAMENARLLGELHQRT